MHDVARPAVHNRRNDQIFRKPGVGACGDPVGHLYIVVQQPRMVDGAGDESCGIVLVAQVSEKYMALARVVLDGEKALFASWAETVTAATPVLLREPVLCRTGTADGQQAGILVNYPPALLEARFGGSRQTLFIGSYAVVDTGGHIRTGSGASRPMLSAAIHSCHAVAANLGCSSRSSLMSILRQMMGTGCIHACR